MASLQHITKEELEKVVSLNTTWVNMQSRCTLKTSTNFKNWGGRGIKCEWKNFHEFFLDMHSSWQKELSIERINNDGNYSKDNCKWATTKQQARNRRNVPLIKFCNKVKSLAEWCEIYNLSSSMVRQRYYVYKWPIEKCLLTPKYTK